MRRVALCLRAICLLGIACGFFACQGQPSIELVRAPDDTRDVVGPYRVDAVVRGAEPDDRIELFYNPIDRDREHYIPLPMHGLDEDGQVAELFSAEIPGQPAEQAVRFYIAIERDGDRVAEEPTGGDLRPFVFEVLP